MSRKLKNMINLAPWPSRLLKVIALGAFSLALSLCLLKKTIGSEHKAKPNVLFVAIDDLNDWVSCLGGRVGVRTPNLDRLASRGVLFTNAHCTAPSCNPSRASLLTGIRPSTSGVYVNNQNWRRAPMLQHAVTIPQYFRDQGYRSVGGGKIFHAGSWMNACGRDGFNDDGSWDSYLPSLRRAMPDEIRPRDWPVNGLVPTENLVRAFKPCGSLDFFPYSSDRKNAISGGQMPFCKMILVFVRGLIVSRAKLSLELLVLRHQLVVLRRKVQRPQIHNHDRLFGLWSRESGRISGKH